MEMRNGRHQKGQNEQGYGGSRKLQTLILLGQEVVNKKGKT